MNKQTIQRIEKLEFNKRLVDPDRMTLDEYYDAPNHIQDEIFGDWYDNTVDVQHNKPNSDKVKAWLKEHRQGKQ